MPDTAAVRRFAQHCEPIVRHLRIRHMRDVEAASDWIFSQTWLHSVA